ncbi:hypothetical protein TrVE_jg7850 [Triparma verrucosa]|uniref:Uncharacterized protein n=1 Tax=Triparma verrucosa TaxID=1606542 RepID=A0A9W7EZ62_9STRA|nr:hypothetical protein TrVE_jg7850 [Triparma verrucosa]
MSDLVSKVKALEAELKEAVARLGAERETNARLNAEKEAAAAQLDAERKEKDEAVRKLATVVNEINRDATLQARRLRADATATSNDSEPFDRDNPRVKKVGANVLSENTMINNCRTNVTIHEKMEAFLEALLGDRSEVDKALFQEVLEEGVSYWSFMITITKSCDLLLRMRVERQDEDKVVVKVESVEEEELEATSLPNPHSTATKKLWLLLEEGTIVLRPLPFGQTLFTFKAQVDVGEVTKDAIIASPSSFRKSTTRTRPTTAASIPSAISGVTSSRGAALKRLGAGDEADKANKLFCRLAEMFYERFKKEDVIDERRKADFIENGIPNAPPLTGDEQKMIKESMELVASRAKRIAGTVNESVEKFLYRAEEVRRVIGGAQVDKAQVA